MEERHIFSHNNDNYLLFYIIKPTIRKKIGQPIRRQIDLPFSER